MTSVVEIRTPLPTVQGTLQQSSGGHGIAGTVSGVEAAIHCGDELWFGVVMEVSERDQNLAKHKFISIKAIRSAP